MKRLVLLTQHGKAPAIAPSLAQAGFAVTTAGGFDTDTFGTFSGETARVGSQLNAATVKARKACELTGERYGLGSEGSFGPDPYLALTPWAVEVLVWWDAHEKRAVQATVQGGATNYAQSTVSSWGEAVNFARDVQFPSHGLIAGRPGDAYFSKDIVDLSDLKARLSPALAIAPVWLETDMRAHRNPTRIAMITLCAQRLSTLLQQHCPGCASIGFGLETAIAGARCDQCGRPTLAIRAKRTQCAVCDLSVDYEVQTTVPASQCQFCNP